MAPTRAALQRLIERCGIKLSSVQYDRLWAYHRLLREANAELNLTRIHNFENMVLKHYVDSLLVLEHAELPTPLIDMGSGPGLPGIPLKIARPSLHMILAEPRGARADFLKRAIQELGLDRIEVHAGKIGPKYDRPVSGVITRAVASIPETLDSVANCLTVGGKMLFMKGPDCDGEIAEAKESLAEQFRLEQDVAYVIPGTTHQRRLVVYQRLDAPARAVLRSDEEPSSRRPDREIASDANPQYKSLKELLQPKGIRDQGRALIAGSRVVAEVLERHRDRAEVWITSADGPPPPIADLPWQRLADGLFRELDVSGTKAPLLVTAVPPFEPWSDADDADHPLGCTLFLPFQDPENVGAAIRSAAAFGASRVVALRECAHPFHPKSVRAAGTALFQVEFRRGPSLQDLESSRLPLIALDPRGPSLQDVEWPERFGLILGLEGPGLPETLRQRCQARRIPIAEGIESLNAAASAAVALYEWRRQRLETRKENTP